MILPVADNNRSRRLPLVVEPRILDRDTRGCSERPDDNLILYVELGPALLLSEVGFPKASSRTRTGTPRNVRIGG